MSKHFGMLLIAISISISLTSFAAFAEGAWSGDMYNPREEVEYSYRATMERRDERNREIQFQRYQQKQHLEQQRLINQQDLYNQTHQRKKQLNSSIQSEQ